jgi:transcriptional regulator with XRE-family HTH domain
MPLTQRLERHAWQRGFRDRDSGSACLEYGSTQHMPSSSTRRTFHHEEAIPYASGMASKSNFGFGARLKEARQRAGLSGTELGKGAGENGKDASKASVSDWENDRHYPKADQLRVICLKLNISSDFLVFGDIRDELNLIQAETTIQMLTPDQRRSLLAKMMGDAAPDETVEKKMPITRTPPAPSPLHVSAKTIDRESPKRVTHPRTDTDGNTSNRIREWVTKEGDDASGHSDSDESAKPRRERAKGR